MFYFLFFFQKLTHYVVDDTPPATVNAPPVTILICAHNESQNLKRNLPRILNQTYRSHQVLVINHNSDDDSEKILRYLQQKFSHLDFINFSNNKKMQVGKKHALAFGIEKARHEVLLLTDADCYPISKFWLANMSRSIDDKFEIGLGYGPYEKRASFLNKCIRFETILAATQYLSYAIKGIPYMGVGRNLIYKKRLYHITNGFKKHENIASGDDDLFVNAVANAQNTRIILSKDAFVYSSPKHTWLAWYRQKTRHLSTSTHYKPIHQALLGGYSASHFMHYFLGIYSAIQGYWVLAICFYFLRTMIMLFVFRGILKKLDDAILLKWIPLLDAAFVLYYVVFAPTLIFGSRKRW